MEALAFLPCSLEADCSAAFLADNSSLNIVAFFLYFDLSTTPSQSDSTKGTIDTAYFSLFMDDGHSRDLSNTTQTSSVTRGALKMKQDLKAPTVFASWTCPAVFLADVTSVKMAALFSSRYPQPSHRISDIRNENNSVWVTVCVSIDS
jgi:hypothetical protein